MTERDAWDIYFAGIVSIRMHPGNDATHIAPEDVIELARKMANHMINVRRKEWRGSAQQSPESSATSDKKTQTIKTDK